MFDLDDFEVKITPKYFLMEKGLRSAFMYEMYERFKRPSLGFIIIVIITIIASISINEWFIIGLLSFVLFVVFMYYRDLRSFYQENKFIETFYNGKGFFIKVNQVGIIYQSIEKEYVSIQKWKTFTRLKIFDKARFFVLRQPAHNKYLFFFESEMGGNDYKKLLTKVRYYMNLDGNYSAKKAED